MGSLDFDQIRKELMQKANLPEMMKEPGKNGPSLDQEILEIPPKPKK